MRLITNWPSSLISAAGVCLVTAMGLFSATAFAAEYHVDTKADNLVRFVSDAPVEDFDGVTSQIDGYVLWPGDQLEKPGDLDKSEFYFEVPLGTLETGIKLRDSHMREEYLETKDFPYASYSGRLSAVNMTDSGTYAITVTGDFTLHGVKRATDIMCYAKQVDGGYLITSDFSLKLTDYNIDVPSLMFLKIDEEIQLELKFHLKDVKQAE